MRANIVGPLDVATRSAPPLQVAIPSLVLGLWKLGYVGAGILKSDKPATRGNGIGSSKRRDHDISLSGQGQEESRASDHGHCNGCAAADGVHLRICLQVF